MKAEKAADSKVRARDSFLPDVLSFRLNLSLLLKPQKTFGTDKLKILLYREIQTIIK